MSKFITFTATNNTDKTVPLNMAMYRYNADGMYRYNVDGGWEAATNITYKPSTADEPAKTTIDWYGTYNDNTAGPVWSDPNAPQPIPNNPWGTQPVQPWPPQPVPVNPIVIPVVDPRVDELDERLKKIEKQLAKPEKPAPKAKPVKAAPPEKSDVDETAPIDLERFKRLAEDAT